MSNEANRSKIRREEVAKQLGMNWGKANSILLRKIIFSLYESCEKNSCFRCTNPMSTNDYSIEHIVPWRNNLKNGKSLFFDLANVSFSHLDCNISFKSLQDNLKNKPTVIPSGHSWCQSCQKTLSNICFRRKRGQYSKRCLNCIAKGSGIEKRVENRQKINKDILKVSIGAANHNLKKSILYDLITRNNLNHCFVCEKPMQRDNYSIEHKEAWLHHPNAKELYFSFDNIAFSHKSCNYGGAKKINKIEWPEGQAWCSCCKSFKLLNFFPPSKITGKGRGIHCTQCNTEKRSKYKRNR